MLVGCGPEAQLSEGTEATGTAESAVYESPDSLMGLLGSYSRGSWPLAASGELVSMSLSGTSETPERVEGSYIRTLGTTCPAGGCTQSGSFVALASNPAVGAVLLFKDPLGVERDYYSIVSIQRSAFTGKITNIVLVKGNTPGAQQFTMNRTSF
jgi:hypothetical protein